MIGEVLLLVMLVGLVDRLPVVLAASVIRYNDPWNQIYIKLMRYC